MSRLKGQKFTKNYISKSLAKAYILQYNLQKAI